METAALRSEGWSFPPAARVVWYRRPKELLCSAEPFEPMSPHKEASRPTVVRYAVYGKPLPRVQDALKLGETLRAALMRILQDRLGRVPEMLFGHGANGPNGHRHAFFLSEPDEKGRITHLMIYAPAGVEPQAASAMGSVRKIFYNDGQEWDLWLEGVEAPSDFAAQSPLVRSSRRWVSCTPYMHPWHVKKNLGCRDQILKECRIRGLPELSQVDPLGEVVFGSRPLRPVHFHRFRSKRGLVQPDRRGSFWTLEFDQSVTGPLALGFACHFGMGLFLPST